MLYEITADIIVIGAGISGLSASYFVSLDGKKVIIIEKNARTGGTVQSERLQGFLVEYGPNSVLETHPAIGELLEGLGIENMMEYASERAKNRYIVKNGKLMALPLGPLAFLRTPLFSARAKLRLCLEPLIKPSDPEVDETLAQFVQRRLGNEFLDYAIDPFVAGVYAGMPEQLSVKSAFPKLYALEQEYGSLIKGAILGARKRKKRKEVAKSRAKLFSFPEGLSTLIHALERKLASSIHVEAIICAVRKIASGYEVDFQKGGDLWRVRGKALLFTIPAYAYKDMAIEFEFPVREALGKIYYPPIAIVYWGFHSNPSQIPMDGFGFLVPRKENRSFLGTLWSSSIFSGRSLDGGASLTSFIGGSRQPENALLSDSEMETRMRKELFDLMGIARDPDMEVIYRVPKAIPQYTTGHQKIMQELSVFEERHKGLYLRGNFRGGIAMGDIIRESQAIAQIIQEQVF